MGLGHPHDDVAPNFFPDSKSSLLGLLNDVSFVTKLFFINDENRGEKKYNKQLRETIY